MATSRIQRTVDICVIEAPTLVFSRSPATLSKLVRLSIVRYWANSSVMDSIGLLGSGGASWRGVEGYCMVGSECMARKVRKTPKRATGTFRSTDWLCGGACGAEMRDACWKTPHQAPLTPPCRSKSRGREVSLHAPDNASQSLDPWLDIYTMSGDVGDDDDTLEVSFPSGFACPG